MVFTNASVKAEPKGGKQEAQGTDGDVTKDDDKANDTATKASAGERTRLFLAKDWASRVMQGFSATPKIISPRRI